ncbi:hypothetical protein [Cetobacterium sp.]|uniref:hypothetical protein n=1 Tax=Cetobacterium sp. TaxID=2071632 RepID=UPI003F3C701C
MIKLIKAGVDTVQIEVEGLHSIKSDNGYILNDKTTYTAKQNTRIVMKCTNDLATPKEMLNNIKTLENNIKIKKMKITRVDLGADMKEFMKDNKNLLRLFLECLNTLRKKDCSEIFKTIKGLEKDGNIKISSKRVETTIYSCPDKNRPGNTRVENRIKDIRSKENNKIIIQNEIKKYIEELRSLELFIQKVEEKYISELTTLYKETIDKKYRTFSEFIATMDSNGYILTFEILRGLMTNVGIKQHPNTFAKNFRRLRNKTLNFTTKTDLKKFTKSLQKNLKKSAKN